MYQNLVNVLETLLLELDRTCIILDALDECKDINVLVQLISWLRISANGQLHILLTSQPRKIFLKALEDELCSNPDLEHLVRCTKEVVTKVLEKSNRMFRLAASLLYKLSCRKLDTDLDTILANFPGNLFGIYGHFLEAID
ncbi:hypothetical protein B0H10DRAFT_1956112 [Mycena sp. CBHHK59/15]|nr:hypothetical protein B0H10DRAFT_1956112 [Mycena sp. CBHHK59/15]